MARFVSTRNGDLINIDLINAVKRMRHRQYVLFDQAGNTYDYDGDLKEFDDIVVVPAAPGSYVIAIYMPPLDAKPDDKPTWYKETVVAWSMTRTADGYYEWPEPVLLLPRDTCWHYLYPTAEGKFYSPDMECRFSKILNGVAEVVLYLQERRKEEEGGEG